MTNTSQSSKDGKPFVFLGSPINSASDQNIFNENSKNGPKDSAAKRKMANASQVGKSTSHYEICVVKIKIYKIFVAVGFYVNFPQGYVDFPIWEVLGSVFNVWFGGTVIWSPFCIFKIIIEISAAVYWTSQKINRFSIFFGLGSVDHKVRVLI